MVRLIALAQIALPLWQNLRRVAAEGSHAVVLGMFVTGTPALAYQVVLGVLWVIAGVGLWRLSEKGWKLSMALYGWLILSLLIVAVRAFFAGPSQLILMPSGKLVAGLFVVLAAATSLVARVLYRRRHLFQ